jgi:large subunit ribosomal protein L25
VLKEYQQDKVRGTIIHVDLQEVRLDQPIHATVPVTLVGEPAGAKEGGVLSQVATEVTVEALPLDVPQHLEVDVSEMHIGESLRLDAVQTPDGVRLLDDPEAVLATVTQPTRVEEPEEEVEEAEAAEGAPEEEAPESATEAPAEPGAPAAGGEGTAPG